MGQDRRLEVLERFVWTKKSTSNAIAHPISGALSAAAVGSVRVAELIVHDQSTNLTVAIGYQLADEDDEESWGSAMVLSAAWATAVGTTYESAFTDLSSVTQRKIRFVVLAKNQTGAAIEVGRVGAKLDIREV